MLKPVSITESELQNARRQLERILANTRFARNERLARFLRFIVERHLEGKDDESMPLMRGKGPTDGVASVTNRQGS